MREGRMFPMFMRLRTLRQGQIDYAYDVPLQTPVRHSPDAGKLHPARDGDRDGRTASLPFTVTSGPASPN